MLIMKSRLLHMEYNQSQQILNWNKCHLRQIELKKYLKVQLIDLHSLFIIMSESQDGEIELQEDGSDWENDNNKKAKIKKRTKRFKKGKKEGKVGTFISSTYRRQKCQFYNKGNCIKGNLCTYSHDFQPDTAKKICKFYLGGSCSKGDECQYSHNTKIYPCKFYHIQNRCNLNINCRFSHNPIPSDFYQEYMKDNKDFILKLYKQGKLPNKNLVEFIQDDLPKKDMIPPPIMPITSKPTMKAQNNMVWTNILKKDPRQRIKPKPEQPAVILVESIVKQQEKQIKVKQESLEEKFIRNIKHYFYSYY